MACAGGTGASVGGSLAGLATEGMVGIKGFVAFTFDGKVMYSVFEGVAGMPHYVYNWATGEWAKMANVSKLIPGLTTLAFAVESYGNVASWRAGGSNGKLAIDQTMTTIGLRFPLVGASYTLAPIIGPPILDQ